MQNKVDSAACELVTVPHVSKVMGVSSRAVRRMLQDGELQGVRLGNRWYVSRAYLADKLGLSEV